MKNAQKNLCHEVVREHWANRGNLDLYKEYENNQNDIKQQREGFINARDNMPNNTFIKLFHNFSAEENQKQDELQSIQYVDQNYVESSVDTENEFDRREG